jgi:hypothetical protein
MFTSLLCLFLWFGLWTLVLGATAYATPQSLGTVTTCRLVSSGIATVSHLYIAAIYIWSSTDSNNYILATYVVFFSGVLLGLPAVLLSIYRARKLALVCISWALMVVSSLVLCVFSCLLVVPIVLKVPLVVATVYITVHHAVVDGLWWWFFPLDPVALLDLNYYQDETI